jgi:K+-sensing histidine kinase KdpD
MEATKPDMISGVQQKLEGENPVSTRDNHGHTSGWLSALRKFSSVPGSGTLAGGVLCVVAAILAVVFAHGHAWQVDVPLLFTVVLLVVALLFGTRAGVIGTLLAALVFATHLFNPVGSIRISCIAARSNLGWMLMIGIAFSFLFAPHKSSLKRE